jgi:hypothetical protein
MNEVVTHITIRLSDGTCLSFKGRDAWTLHALIEAGERGVTPLERPAPRWSAYVFDLRKAGLIIETIDERHAGAFKGSHGRYVLRSPLTLESVERHESRAA